MALRSGSAPLQRDLDFRPRILSHSSAIIGCCNMTPGLAPVKGGSQRYVEKLRPTSRPDQAGLRRDSIEPHAAWRRRRWTAMANRETYDHS